MLHDLDMHILRYHTPSEEAERKLSGSSRNVRQAFTTWYPPWGNIRGEQGLRR